MFIISWSHLSRSLPVCSFYFTRVEGSLGDVSLPSVVGWSYRCGTHRYGSWPFLNKPRLLTLKHLRDTLVWETFFLSPAASHHAHWLATSYLAEPPLCRKTSTPLSILLPETTISSSHTPQAPWRPQVSVCVVGGVPSKPGCSYSYETPIQLLESEDILRDEHPY